MQSLTAAIETLGPEDTVVHVGPGALSGFDRYPATAATVVLVEAEAGQAAALGPRLAHLPRTRVLHRILHGALVADGAEPLLRRYNFPLFDSVQPPTGVRRIYPGLRETGRDSVPVLSVAALLETLPPPGPDRSDVLVIEAAGQVRTLLDGIEAADGLGRFGQLICRVGEQSLFEGEATHAEMVRWLEDRGWHIVPEPAEEDPDYPVLVARAEPGAASAEDDFVRAERDELAEAVASLTGQAADLAHRLSEAEAVRDQARERSETLTKEAEAAAALRGELDEVRGLLTGRETALQEAGTQVETQAAEIETLRAELDEVRGLLTGREAALQEAGTRVEAQAAEIETLRAELAEITPSEELRAQCASAQERAAELSQTMIADQRMALRLQAGLQADLKALQDRYAMVLEEKEARDRLLVQVTRRLGDAADYLKALPDDADDRASPADIEQD